MDLPACGLLFVDLGRSGQDFSEKTRKSAKKPTFTCNERTAADNLKQILVVFDCIQKIQKNQMISIEIFCDPTYDVLRIEGRDAIQGKRVVGIDRSFERGIERNGDRFDGCLKNWV